LGKGAPLGEPNIKEADAHMPGRFEKYKIAGIGALPQ